MTVRNLIAALQETPPERLDESISAYVVDGDDGERMAVKGYDHDDSTGELTLVIEP